MSDNHAYLSGSCLETQQNGYNVGKELRSAASYPPATKPRQESTAMLTWERRSSGRPGPDAYFCDEARYAIFPEVGGNGWELCWIADPDGGYELLNFCDTVREAKQYAERYAERARLSAANEV